MSALHPESGETEPRNQSYITKLQLPSNTLKSLQQFCPDDHFFLSGTVSEPIQITDEQENISQTLPTKGYKLAECCVFTLLTERGRKTHLVPCKSAREVSRTHGTVTKQPNELTRLLVDKKLLSSFQSERLALKTHRNFLIHSCSCLTLRGR